MEPDKYYFDPFTQRNICVVFENTGYCADMSTCKYLHRKRPEIDFEIDAQWQKNKYQKPLQFHEEQIKHIKRERKKMSYSPPDMFREIEKPLPFVKVPHVDMRGKAKQKVDLMPSLKKRPPRPMGSKMSNCNQCRGTFLEDILFCNSFCGHHVCFECTHKDKACKQCSVPVDMDTAIQFFRRYCKRCQTINIPTDTSNLCVECKAEEEVHQLRLKKEAEKIEKTAGDMLCIICFHGKKEHCVLPCAHMLYCEGCIKHVMISKTCFFCNRPVTNAFRIYY